MIHGKVECKNCLGCNRLENKGFKGSNNCKDFIGYEEEKRGEKYEKGVDIWKN